MQNYARCCLNSAMSENIFSVSGKLCIVTGAATGLGAHISRLLLKNGARVVGIGVGEPAWNSAEFGEKFQYFTCDVCEEDAIADVLENVQRTCGSIDVVVNNAGISRVEKSMNFSAEGFRQIMNVNVVAAGLVAAICAKQMRKNGTNGSIINITSVMADSSISGLSAYSATKAALEQLTCGLASEWARYGIRVNNLSPGWFPTGMTNSYIDQGLGQLLKTRIPMSRLGEASELDGACLLLASDASQYMTGSTITVDGGFSLIN